LGLLILRSFFFFPYPGVEAVVSLRDRRDFNPFLAKELAVGVMKKPPPPPSVSGG